MEGEIDMTIYDAFELNRILHKLFSQQSVYEIKTAFKIHSLIKWLNDVETFVFERICAIFGKTQIIDWNDSMYEPILMSKIKFIRTDLTIEELLQTNGKALIDVKDVDILEKFINKLNN